MSKPAHEPVMADRVATWLVTDPMGVYWDATVGVAGHARVIVDRLSEGGKLIGSDRDPLALDLASAALTDAAVTLVPARFSELEQVWRELGVGRLSGILFDFGIGSFQIDDPQRGIAFDRDGPLDMRMDPAGPSLVNWLNHAKEREMADAIFRWGEERQARSIARAIVGRRPLNTTFELRDAILSVAPRHRTKSVARVFQAFRIWVNDELGEIGHALNALKVMLAVGGRVATLSYHSLEDRAVKQFVRTAASECICPPRAPQCTCNHTAWLKPLTRRPEVPGEDEVRGNSRARSAKLRVAERRA
jgi:16S rRNA (cytosine1402-N4)-methyltransferase